MELNVKKVELRILRADEGMVLTDGDTFSSEGGEVYLGVGDSPENWTEITSAEAEEIRNAEREKLMSEENTYHKASAGE